MAGDKKIDLGMRPLEAIRAMTEALGLKLGPKGKEHRPFPDWVETSIQSGRTTWARIVYYTNGGDGVGSLHLHPPEAGSIQILAGRGRIESEAELEQVLEEIEGLLRTRLVVEKKLAFEQFPSDRSLRRWARQIVDECGPGAGRFKARSAVAKEAWRDCAAIAGAFDRETAIRTQRRLADLRGEVWKDESLRYMASSASGMADVPFSRHKLAWDTGSRDSYIAHRTEPAPTRKPL